MLSSLATAVASAPCVVAYGPHFFGWWWIFIPIFWILVFVLIFAFAGRRWRRAAMERGGYGPGGWGPRGGTRSAESTLAQRYANGDIDEQEYRARLEVLRANRDGA
ncbi:SHOCT domain-containing protein [Leifsonia virtsii]|uniref:SHOCT domain-containing protein n=1 Tax=Leifsonia virtsii TaxID=3035915 RepID=A0ABT8ITU4_9MICO|nr:SHOCT domain-containing protein [Leifsonia virtsii]MDN4596215.1 SHOCT domain-containing protein [Leifsonia virtsii]